MKFSSVCSTLVLAAVAIAAPADLEARTDETVGHAQEQCSAGQVISCCNPSSTANKDGTLLGLLGLDSIFGNSCTGISAAVCTSNPHSPLFPFASSSEP